MNKTVQNLKIEVELMGKTHTEGILKLLWEFIQGLQSKLYPQNTDLEERI